MMNLRTLLLNTLLLVFSAALSGQYYETGQDPASLKWNQIKTDRFRIIYPEKYGNEGIAYARSLDSAYSKLMALFPPKKFRIPVIIHNFTTQSNGYVSWAPRRMELYPTPEQNSLPLDPKTYLSLHELTHVFQMQSINTGFTRIMSYGLGEQFIGFVSSLLPLWYLEGGAVLSESILTGSGRGRSPAFQRQLKALATEKGMYKYDKMINGSYRDFVPDHYQTGYQMVAWSFARYDHQLWNNALRVTANQPFLINPVNISLNNQARLTKSRLFYETFNGMESKWKDDLLKRETRSYETISPPKKGKYINYYSPVIAGNDSVIAIKTSLSEPVSFVLIRPSLKSEKKIHVPGYVYPRYMSHAMGKIVWVENSSDPRWENRNFSVIKVMDIKTQRTTKLTSRTRYLSAAISPEGTMIAAVENTPDNKNHLVLIDPMTGSVIHSVPSPGNVYLQKPQWSPDGLILTVIFLSKAGEGIMAYSTDSREWQTLIEPGTDDIQSSFIRNDSLFYVSSSSGTDNIYIITSDKKISVTDSRFGAGDPYISGSNIIFTDYSVSGNDISFLRLDSNLTEINTHPTTSSYLINQITLHEPAPLIIDTTYNPVPYRKWQHLFNIHSWMPFYADIEAIQSDPASIRPGLTIMSQNHLSTLISSVGYEYSSDKRHKLHSKVTWKGWYPVIESRLDYGNEPGIDKLRETVPDPQSIQPGFRFLNTISLPLGFNSGKFIRIFQPSITSDYRNNYVYLKEIQRYDYGQTQFSTRLYFSNYFRSSLRDIYPKWAQMLDLNYTFSPFDKDINGTTRSIRTAFYFPGIMPNNSIRLRFEKEKQEPAKYYMGNRVRWPRSYENIFSQDLNFASVDYVMPLLYPDLSIPRIFFMKRIRGSVFYDYARGKDNAHFKEGPSGIVFDYFQGSFESFESFGFELFSDFHLFTSPYMISAGVQGAWKDLNSAPTFEFLLNIDVFGMTIGRW